MLDLYFNFKFYFGNDLGWKFGVFWSYGIGSGSFIIEYAVIIYNFVWLYSMLVSGSCGVK